MALPLSQRGGMEITMKKGIVKDFIVDLFVTFLLHDSSTAQNRQVLSKVQQVTGDRFTVGARSPKGATIYAVKAPSSSMMSAIDQGLTDLFAVARRNGYSRRLSFADYTIFIANADR